MATRTFADIERIVERYDTATTELDAAVTGRIGDSLDASYRNLERELRRLYPTWQSDGSLYAVQRRLLLMEQLGETLAVVRPEMKGEYERLFTEALQISHESGGRMADELVRSRDPGYPLQEFTTVPIEAAIAQARDGVQRLYRYNDNFKVAVSGVVEQGLLQGWGAEKVARMLRGNEQMQGQFGLAQLKSKAETIARTEIMGSFDRATQQRYAENGITHIQWLASPSERLCSYCLARHGNVYKLGEVSAPAHPRCRCITTSWLPKWAERGWTDDAAIAADKTARIAEMEALGTRPNNGPTYWEKRAGLTAAPKAVWKPGDAAPKPKPEPKPPKPPKPKPEPKVEPRPKVKLPKDVEVYKDRGYRTYDFESPSGGTISLEYHKKDKSKYYDVEFKVDDSYDRVEMSPRDGTKIALKLSRCHQYEVSKAKDGTIYRTEPYSADGAGEGRAKWYQRMGFSAPQGPPIIGQDGAEVALGTQYGVVRNGRLVPSDEDGNPIKADGLIKPKPGQAATPEPTPQPAPIAAASSAPVDYKAPLREQALSDFKELGRGAYGVVVLDEVNNVALKYSTGTGAVSSDKEIGILKKASELGFGPKLYEANRNAIAMEYLKGYTDAGNIRGVAELPLDQQKTLTKNYFRQMEAMHSAGIAHGDMHSQNVMFDINTLDVKIIDYGLAKEVGAGKPVGSKDFKTIRETMGAQTPIGDGLPVLMAPEIDELLALAAKGGIKNQTEFYRRIYKAIDGLTEVEKLEFDDLFDDDF